MSSKRNYLIKRPYNIYCNFTLFFSLERCHKVLKEEISVSSKLETPPTSTVPSPKSSPFAIDLKIKSCVTSASSVPFPISRAKWPSGLGWIWSAARSLCAHLRTMDGPFLALRPQNGPDAIWKADTLQRDGNWWNLEGRSCSQIYLVPESTRS